MSNRKVRFPPGRKTRYRMNNKSFGEFIMSPQAMKPTMQVGQAIARRAAIRAPRSGDGEDTPYADSFTVQPIPEGIVAGKRYPNRRVAVEVGNTAEHGPAIEFGRYNVKEGTRAPHGALESRVRTPGRRILLRAGLRFGTTNVTLTRAAAARDYRVD